MGEGREAMDGQGVRAQAFEPRIKEDPNFTENLQLAGGPEIGSTRMFGMGGYVGDHVPVKILYSTKISAIRHPQTID